MNLIEQLQKAGIPLAEQEPMTRRTTFGIGGPALLLRPRSRAELQAAMTLCREAGEEPFILGRGSNLLVSLLAILCKLHRNSEKLFNTAEDVLEGEFLSHSFRTSEMGHNDERTAFFKYLLEGRNCGTNPCVVSDFEFFVERNIEVHTNNGFLASEIVS